MFRREAQYPVQGDPREADFIFIHEFGVGRNGTPGAVNLALARMALDFQRELGDVPIAGTQLVSAALWQASAEECTVNYSVEDIVPGKPSGLFGGGIGTDGEAQAFKVFVERGSYHRPMVLGQARHMERAVQQDIDAGIDPGSLIIPPGLPDIYDHDSLQVWTRDPRFFAAREVAVKAVLGVLKLKKRLVYSALHTIQAFSGMNGRRHPTE